VHTDLPRPAIGVDVGGTKVEAIALARDGRELWRRREATPAGDYDGTLRTIAALVAAARAAASADCTVGLGTPGSVTAAGTIKNANSTCLNGRAFPRDVERLLGQPVRIANDADCLALSEATDGAGAGAPVVFAAILGTGIGGGIAVQGRVRQGPNGLRGEWGHNPLPWHGADDPVWECYCGKRGCIETLLSGPGLARDHRERHGGALTAAAIARAVASGDAACAATIARWEDRLARAFAAVVNLLDPDAIVLGGGLSRIERLYRNVPTAMRRHVFLAGSPEPPQIRLVASMHGDASGVRGAAWLWRDA
jgi:fructokinase